MKRSGMKRTKPLRATEPPRATIKPKVCAWCREDYYPSRAMQNVCGPICGLSLARKKREKAESAEHRTKLAESKPLSHWLDLTQRAINAYVRARDHGKPCISCGATQAFAWDAGHYLSRGARPELRFDLENIALQCASCNRHKGGNQAQFRLGLVERIGQEAVDRLEGPHPTARYTREGLAAFRKATAALTRQLQKDRA